MFVGHYMGGVMCYGVTHLIAGPPILGRVPYVQTSLLDKVSVAGRGGSKSLLSIKPFCDFLEHRVKTPRALTSLFLTSGHNAQRPF